MDYKSVTTMIKDKIFAVKGWFLSPHPQGIGTLLVGIAAIIALSQTSSILDQIFQIQKQAKEIESAVRELKAQSGYIASAIDLLGAQLKELKATQTITSSPVLMDPKPTKRQIEEAIQASLLNEPLKNQSSIYLPKGRLNQTVELMYQAKTPTQRTTILQNSLEYKARDVFPNNKGESMSIKDGKYFKFEGDQ